MKKSLFGYSTRDVQSRLDALTEQNTLLMGRLERQDEQIKELRARYASFVTAEAKLKSASRAIAGSLGALEETLGRIGDVAATSRELSDALATVHASVDQARHVQECNAQTERVLLHAQSRIAEALASLQGRSAEIEAQADPEQVAQACGAAEAVAGKLAQSARTLSGLQSELEGLNGAVDAIASVAAQLGRMGNGGLADIERARVTSYLEDIELAGHRKPEPPSVSVKVSDPDALIDNPMPAAVGM